MARDFSTAVEMTERVEVAALKTTSRVPDFPTLANRASPQGIDRRAGGLGLSYGKVRVGRSSRSGAHFAWLYSGLKAHGSMVSPGAVERVSNARCAQ